MNACFARRCCNSFLNRSLRSIKAGPVEMKTTGEIECRNLLIRLIFLAGKYTSLCDVWSYGVLIWEIFSKGENPYPGLSNSEARTKIDLGIILRVPYLPLIVTKSEIIPLW